MPNEIRSVSFIGSGNVAYGLGMALKKVVTIDGVWSRSYDNARELSRRLKCNAVERIDQLLTSDLVIVAVTDQALQYIGEKWCELVDGCEKKLPIIAHTSGSVSMDILNPDDLNLEFGVLYPLQSFTYSRRVSLKRVPFIINGKNERTMSKLQSLAGKISSEVHFMNDEERRKLHLPAVIVNNFVNHLIYLGERIAAEDGFKIDFFLPLIEETVNKIKAIGPYKAQTGPAKRNDIQVMKAQLNRLKHHPELKEIYVLLSNSIKETHHEDHR